MDEWAGSGPCSQKVYGHAGPLCGSSCLFCRNPPWTGPRSEQPLPVSICVWADVRPQLALRSHHQAFSVEEKAPGSSLKPPSLGHLVQALPRGPLFSVGCSQNIDPEGMK